jgi:TfoX/Sxy family transcriptional regulator of competence genes
MAWTKIPKENHPVFYDTLPDDKRVKSIKMFGGVCGTVNGHMFAGLWANSVAVRLAEPDRKKVLKMKGGEHFDPMGRGKPMAEMVVLPEKIMGKVKQLSDWMNKAFEYTASLPPKKKKKKAAAKVKKAKKTTKTTAAPARRASKKRK